MGGIAATEIIRQLPNYSRTKILALTADATFEHKEACLKAGMDDVLHKPIDRTDLQQIIAKCVFSAEQLEQCTA